MSLATWYQQTVTKWTCLSVAFRQCFRDLLKHRRTTEGVGAANTKQEMELAWANVKKK